MSPRAFEVIAGIVLLAQAAVISVLVAGHPPALLPVVTTVGSAALPVSGVNVGVGAIVPLVLGGVLVLTGGASHRRIRWLESSLSTSIMVFLVAQLNGIQELGTLVAIYALTSAAVLFGVLRDRVLHHGTLRDGVLQDGPRAAPSTPAGVFGAMIGIVPWGLIAWYEIAPTVAGEVGPEGWVRVLTLVVLGLFGAGAVLAWRGAGASSRGFAVRFALGIALSVVARSVLAWAVTAAVVGGLLLR